MAVSREGQIEEGKEGAGEDGFLFVGRGCWEVGWESTDVVGVGEML